MIPDYVRLEPGLIVSGPDGRTYYIVRRPLTFTVDWWGLRLVNSSNIYSFDKVYLLMTNVATYTLMS